jgi:hypothetical protein
MSINFNACAEKRERNCILLYEINKSTSRSIHEGGYDMSQLRSWLRTMLSIKRTTLLELQWINMAPEIASGEVGSRAVPAGMSAKVTGWLREIKSNANDSRGGVKDWARCSREGVRPDASTL